MGWVWLSVIGLGAFALLWSMGVSRALATIAAAALLVGGAGYALQQRASLPGQPVTAGAKAIDVDPGLVAFRAAILPASPETEAILAVADDRTRTGDTAAAADALLAAIARRPDDAALWTGLGSTFAAHDDGRVSPAAEFAFRRAFELAPRAPGPPFFLGVAYLQAGELASAKRAWLVALRLAPRDAPYRVEIAERLVRIDQFEAMIKAGAIPR